MKNEDFLKKAHDVMLSVVEASPLYSNRYNPELNCTELKCIEFGAIGLSVRNMNEQTVTRKRGKKNE